jgi:hypothetical protein
LHDRFHVIGKLLAALNVAVCPDLDQHRRLRRFIAWTPSQAIAAVLGASPGAGVVNIAHSARMADALCRFDLSQRSGRFLLQKFLFSHLSG